MSTVYYFCCPVHRVKWWGLTRYAGGWVLGIDHNARAFADRVGYLCEEHQQCGMGPVLVLDELAPEDYREIDPEHRDGRWGVDD